MGTTLTGKTPGSTGGNTFIDLLHTHGGTRATGARVTWGDGANTGLVLWEAGVGIVSADDQVSKIESDATAPRTHNLPDESGNIVLGNGAGVSDIAAFREKLGIYSAKQAVDVSTTLVTPTAVAGFEIPLKASKAYQLYGVLRVESVANTTGLQPRFTGPAASVFSLNVIGRRSAQTLMINALDTDLDFTGMVAANTPEIIILEGMLTTNGVTPASPLGLSISSEVASSEVQLLGDSHLTLTEV